MLLRRFLMQLAKVHAFPVCMSWIILYAFFYSILAFGSKNNDIPETHEKATALASQGYQVVFQQGVFTFSKLFLLLIRENFTLTFQGKLHPPTQWLKSVEYF